ncbi:protein scribble homolog isoform X5 [Octopus sinensis]|uniref:Protein scribble homolog isoform X5 n=1 Tax=Octopus sinensis TaxID=2607531 RepID=A0A7E6ERX9_9MOLL|nr:protein scribble homolog isoform X5 [Octopus sinensis]
MFKCIPLFPACNRQVEYLDRRHWNLTTVPDDVLRYSRSLEELLLDANQLRELPRGFFRLLQLRKLSLSDNEIGRLPPDVSNFVNLMELDISRNELCEIPENIKFCKNLQVFDLSSNPLPRLPEGLTQLRNLTHLGLNDLAIIRLPADLGGLCNLVSLEVRENLLKTLPPSLAQLSKLENLDLGSNEIEILPETIGDLNSLQELWLDCNNLIQLPRELGQLKKLAQLDVSENHLEFLPEEIGGCHNMTDLCLSQNNLETLPEGIGFLKKLSILKCDQNRLATLTAQIGNCESLQEMILTENFLTELPITIGKLGNMNNLNVDRNRLTDIPIEIGKCSKLGVLSLRDNRLLRLPQELGNLKELHVMDVSGNRLEYLPFTVANLNLSALWLSENQAQPMVKFQTEFDERTGQKVLTCFLLPQQAFHTESMGKYENLLRGSIATDQDSRSSWPERSRGSVVHFPDSECSDDEDSPSESQLRRHGTPHPRELKNRHAKLLKKEIDGHVIPHEKDKKDQSFMPQRDPRWLEASDDSGYLEKKSLPQPTYTIPPKENNISKQVGEQSYVSVPYMSTKPEEPEELIKLEPEEVEDTIPKECQPLLLSETLVYPEAIRKPAQMLTPGDSDDIDSSSVERPATNLESDGGFAENEQENGDIGNSENDYADDEQVDPHRRRVIFPPEIEEQPEKENKLRRRDTPHHLKNKRINVMSSKDEADQVREILAQAAATAKMEKMEEKSILKESMSEANESSLLKDVAEEEVSLHVSRAVGQGLGISIAGGKGSTPYKGNDESVFISRVAESGPAALCGVCVGDKLISVNGFNLVDADHYEAVEVLKNSGYDITLVVAREKPVSCPENNVTEEETNTGIATVSFTNEPEMEVYGETISTSLIRDKSGLGFSIAGGRDSDSFKTNDHQFSSFLEAIYISRIIDGAAAHRDGNLFVGDRILSINGIDMQDARHDQAVALLTGSDKEIKLVVYRERVVPKGANVSMESTGSVQKLPQMTQPRITWTSQPAADISLPSVSPGYNNQPMVLKEPSSTHAEPASVTPHLYKPSISASTVPTATITSTTTTVTNQQASPALQTIRHSSHSPNISSACTSPSFRTLSSDWTTPPPTIQPPRFHYPGYSKSPTVATKFTSNEQKESFMQTKSSSASVYQSPVKSSADSRASTSSVNTRAGLPTVSGGSSIPLLTSRDRLPRANLNHEESHAYPVEEITFNTYGGPLGLSIVGGTDHSCLPFGNNNPGIFISKIEKDGIAASTNLKFGDRILSVNDTDLTKATHQEAVMALIKPCNQMTLEVVHEPPLLGLHKYTISKHPDEKLGLRIRGGALTYADNTTNRTDDGIFISNIAPDGAVARHGQLSVGQRILQVNDQSLLGTSHAEAVQTLRSVSDEIEILVCSGHSEEKILPDVTPSPLTPVLHKPDSNSISNISNQKNDDPLVSSQLSEEQQMPQTQLRNEISDQTIPPVESVTLETASVTLRMPDVGPIIQRAQIPNLEADSLTKENREDTLEQPQTDESPSKSQIPLRAKLAPGTKPPIPIKRKSLTLLSKTAVDSEIPVKKCDTLSNTYNSNDINVDHKPLAFSQDAPLASTLPIVHPDTIQTLENAQQLHDNSLQNMKSENPTEGMSFIEKQKYFEREIQHQASGVPRQPTKQFSYLSEHEVARMKQYEEQKASNMSHEELLEYMSPYQETEYNQVLASKTTPPAGSVRTLKAEKRLVPQKMSDSNNVDTSGDNLTTDERAREAEKRAAWRKARMKSLEADTLKAKAVIERANELSQNILSQDPKYKVNPLSTIDIAYADADSSEESSSTQNGDGKHMSTTESETLIHQVLPRGQLSVQKGKGDTTIRRSTHMIDQKVSELTEEVFDENLGKPVLKTYRITEKTLEHEVEVTKQQIYKLKLNDDQYVQSEQQ